jgi:hypothetical protein
MIVVTIIGVIKNRKEGSQYNGQKEETRVPEG